MTSRTKTSGLNCRIARAMALLAALAALGAILAAPAQAARGPELSVKAIWGDTYLPPGGEGQFNVQVRNSGDEGVSEAFEITDTLPEGVTVTGFSWRPIEMEAEFFGGAYIFPVPVSLADFCSGTGTRMFRCAFPEEMTVEPFPGFPGTIHPLTGRTLGYLETDPHLLPAPGSLDWNLAAGPTGYMNLAKLIVDVAVDESASGTGTNVAEVSGGGSAPFADTDPVSFSSTASEFGVTPGSFESESFDGRFPGGAALRKAGAHPYELRVNLDFNEESKLHAGDEVRYTAPHGRVKDVKVTLPRGFIGNPEAMPKCDPVAFAGEGATQNSTACPADTQVGYLNIWPQNGTGNNGYTTVSNDQLTRVALYNLVPPKGQAADLGFKVGGIVQSHIYPALDPAHNYAITTLTPNITDVIGVRGTQVTIWGVPADPAHDSFRAYGEETEIGEDALGAPYGSAPIHPFLSNPMDCGFDNGGAIISADSYNHPGAYTPPEETASHDNVEGCGDPRIRFEPEVALRPTDRHAGAPTGLDVRLKVPQRDDQVKRASDLYAQNGYVKAIPTPPMKKAVVTFPEGMTINPSAAQGLGSCTAAQVGLGTNQPVRCPDDSQYGTLTLHTPILPVDAQPEGWIYIAKQNENPFHNFLSLYLVIQEPDRGILVKIPAKVELDPHTGRIKTTFDDLPQFPVSDMEMHVKGGLRAGLVEPETCGQKTIAATFYSWHDPTTPHTVTSRYEITQDPDGSPCANSLSDRPFDPSFQAGTVNPVAAAFSPMEIDFSRQDTDQQLSVAEGTAPQGLIASLRGIGRCSDAQIAAAENPARSGADEIASPSCPASSQVGTVDAGAGTGQVFTWVKGKVYLAGPYEGAPASGVAIVPAVAGPFDLGVVVTRTPVYIDPVTAQLRIKTDPLPQIFKGVPVRLRDARVHLDRQSFTLNPTSCEEMRFDGALHSAEGKSMSLSNRFQVGSCAELGFKPRLGLKLFGGTGRGAHPALRAVFRPRHGDANAARIQVTLPHSAFLDQAHIRTICTRVQFAAGEGHGSRCPKASIYGHVTVWTPLLDEPLTGPVFLRSSNHDLPDMVAAVSGPPSLPVHFESVARIDSVKGGIRSTFTFFPDVPLSAAVLTMQGGKKGLIVNSTNLCAGKRRARANLAAHNGKRHLVRSLVRAVKCSKARHKKHKGHHEKRGGRTGGKSHKKR